MLYKKFKSVEKEISLLGMGVMRLPADKDGNIDEKECIDLIRHCIDNGINYIDTGYTYHGGKSETVIGKALKDGYREKVLIADKMPIWLVKTEEDLEKYFNEQLERLDVDCIDMYLDHNIVDENWKITKDCNMFGFLDRKKAEGKIKHAGFSFHGDYELFKEVVDAYPWEFCQIQLNYTDRDQQATLKGLEYAREKGLDVIIMEPLKGGNLTDKIPPSVQEIWDRAVSEGIAPKERTPAEWAFKWVASQPGVSLILSGMGSYSQIDENIAVFSREDLTQLSDAESAIIDEVTAEYKRKIKYGCTGCNYCTPCPEKIDIPGVIENLNIWYAFEKNPDSKDTYVNYADKHGSDCIHCKACEEKCPQGLPISDIMNELVEQFGK